MTFGFGFIVPIGSSCAVSPFPNKAGIAAALLGATMFIGTSIFTGLSSRLSEDSQNPIFIYVLALSLLSFLLILIPHYSKKHKA